jgi:TetR/AcrR family transcriptional regulator, regulator of autoinduction and epiphytic fitness
MQQVIARPKGRGTARAHPLRDRAYVRPAILSAARQLFKTVDYEVISVERIAATAEVSRYTLNNHFSSKEEIFRLSREALLAEAGDLVADVIPIRMETRDGIMFFLENCFAVFTSSANLEIMTSILRDGRHHPWLQEAHQKQVRGRLIQNCETFLLYHVDRADEVFANTRLLAEQLTALAETMAYGPYCNSKGKGVRSPGDRARNFELAARAITSMFDSGFGPLPTRPNGSHDTVMS